MPSFKSLGKTRRRPGSGSADVAGQDGDAQTVPCHRLHGGGAIDTVLDARLREGAGDQHAIVELVMHSRSNPKTSMFERSHDVAGLPLRSINAKGRLGEAAAYQCLRRSSGKADGQIRVAAAQIQLRIGTDDTKLYARMPIEKLPDVGRQIAVQQHFGAGDPQAPSQPQVLAEDLAFDIAQVFPTRSTVS